MIYDSLHLLQMVLLLLLIFGMYRWAVSLPKWNYVPLVLLRQAGEIHPVYGRYRRRIGKVNLYAFDKYEIWRFIEKRKSMYPFYGASQMSK